MNRKLIPNLTVIILTHNSEMVIKRAIESALFAGEVLVIDENSQDGTKKVASHLGARVVETGIKNFAQKRNLGLKEAKGEWIFYLDSDEVINKNLEEEIRQIITREYVGVYTVGRRNIFLGTEMYPDQVERLFYKQRLVRWEGTVHEHPIVESKISHLENQLDHFTHTDIASMLEKTNEWSEVEADLRVKAKHPPVVWWRLVRIALTVWWEQLWYKKIYRYGREGWFEAYFQFIDKLIVYTKLWEKQRDENN